MDLEYVEKDLDQLRIFARSSRSSQSTKKWLFNYLSSAEQGNQIDDCINRR